MLFKCYESNLESLSIQEGQKFNGKIVNQRAVPYKKGG
jgi:hypothetical protein